MQISNKFLEELKYRTNIGDVVSGYVDVKRRGRNLVGLCPFHSEKTPSFVVYEESQSFYCFGCGAGGDAISFVKRMENLDYVESVKLLAERCGLPMPQGEYDDRSEKQRAVILEINREAARFFHTSLLGDQGKSALAYLRKRGLTDSLIKRFGLGYAPDSWDASRDHLTNKGYSASDIDAAGLTGTTKQGKKYSYFRNRVMFPIIDLRGNVIGFGGRALTDSGPKYLNSPDTPVFKKSRNLFSLNFAKNTKENYLILSEGYMDSISMYKAGLDNIVATLGTALTEDQARLLSRFTEEVVVAYDSDEAGKKATKRAIDLLKRIGLHVRILSIEGAKDPDEYVNKYGPDKLKLLLSGSGDSTSYQLEAIKRKYDVTTDEGKVACLKEVVAVLASLSSPIERDVYIGSVSKDLEVSRMSIEESLKRLFRYQQKEKEKKQRYSGGPLGGPDPFDKMNPERKADLKAAACEEQIIAALLKNPDFLSHTEVKLSPEQFSTGMGNRIFSVILQTIEGMGEFHISDASHQLSDIEISYLSGIIAKYQNVRFSVDDVLALIGTIEEQKSKLKSDRIAKLGSEEYRDYLARLSDKKK